MVVGPVVGSPRNRGRGICPPLSLLVVGGRVFVSSAPASVVFGDGGRPQLAAAQRPASHAARPADLLFAPAVGAQVVPPAPLQQHLDLPTPLFVHRDLPGEVRALVPAGAQRRRGRGAGGEALQRAVLGGQVGRRRPFPVELGALLLQRRAGGEDLDVVARVLALGPLAFEPFFGEELGEKREREKGKRIISVPWVPARFLGVKEGV